MMSIRAWNSAAHVPVFLDMGGEDSPLDDALLRCLRLLSANETELARATGLPTDTEEQVTFSYYPSSAMFIQLHEQLCAYRLLQQLKHCNVKE
jgi:sugar/nucleoside kinase (ribokinase family)